MASINGNFSGSGHSHAKPLTEDELKELSTTKKQMLDFMNSLEALPEISAEDPDNDRKIKYLPVFTSIEQVGKHEIIFTKVKEKVMQTLNWYFESNSPRAYLDFQRFFCNDRSSTTKDIRKLALWLFNYVKDKETKHKQANDGNPPDWVEIFLKHKDISIILNVPNEKTFKKLYRKALL